MNSLIAIALSSAAAGILDITATGSLKKLQGLPFRQLLQFVASGALGEAAFQGGLNTATVGLLLHFLIAVLWSVVYLLLSHEIPDALTRPFVFGASFGIMVHLFMSSIVVPLSRTPKRPFAWEAWLIQLAIHMLFVGLPIALIQSWWLKR